MSVDANELAAGLLTCPQVHALHAGPHGTITTDSVTGPILGVLIAPAMIMLGLVVAAGVDHDHLVSRIRAALALRAPGVPVTLSIRTIDRPSR